MVAGTQCARKLLLIVVVFKAPSWGFGATSRCGPQTLPQVREWIRKPRVRALGGPRLQVCSSALPVMLSEDKARFSGSSGPVTAVPQRVFAPGKGGGQPWDNWLARHPPSCRTQVEVTEQSQKQLWAASLALSETWPVVHAVCVCVCVWCVHTCGRAWVC